MLDFLELIQDENEEIVCDIFVKLIGSSIYQYTDGIPLIYDNKSGCVVFADAAYVLATLVDQDTFEHIQECICYMINEGHESSYEWDEVDSISFSYKLRRQNEN